MISFTDIAVVFWMMLLRVGVPLLVVIALAYGLKRLDRRWEAEARTHQAKMASTQPEVQPEAPAPQPTGPVAPVRKPARQPAPGQMPFIPPPVRNKEQRPSLYAQPGASASAKHCWDEKGCSNSKKAACAAPSHPDQPCWQARFTAEGHVPEECVTCDVFQRYPTM
jgi:hypothetical protein